MKQKKRDDHGDLISPRQLAERWAMSRTGVINVCQRAGIPTIYIGNTPRGSRRFRLSDVTRSESTCTAL